MRRPSCSPQPFGELVQPCIAAALDLDLRNGREDIIEVCPGSAMSLAYQMELAVEIEAPGILRMAAIDHIDERRDRPCRSGRKGDLPHGLPIHHGALLALPEVLEGCVAARGSHSIGDAAAGAAEGPGLSGVPRWMKE
jgi:hypothetical protein